MAISILTAKGQLLAAEEIVLAVGDQFTPWKVKTPSRKSPQVPRRFSPSMMVSIR